MKRAGKDGGFRRDRSEVISASLTAKEIARLNKLSAEHGGAGRAIQIAVELLAMKSRRLKSDAKPSEGLKQPFSFAAFPRTRALINRLGIRYELNYSEVVRACIEVLEELRSEDEMLDPAYHRLD